MPLTCINIFLQKYATKLLLIRVILAIDYFIYICIDERPFIKTEVNDCFQRSIYQAYLSKLNAFTTKHMINSCHEAVNQLSSSNQVCNNILATLFQTPIHFDLYNIVNDGTWLGPIFSVCGFLERQNAFLFHLLILSIIQD